MKTILVNFEANSTKRYSFNIDNEEIKIGDKIESPAYPNKKLVVYKVLDELFEYGYFNGNLTKIQEDSKQFKIKELKDYKIN